MEHDELEQLIADLDEEQRTDLLAELEAADERERRGEEVAEEAERLAGSLREFTRAAWTVVEPATVFKSNWHIDAMADHLEACTRREIRRLVINIPPRHMKSLSVSVLWPVWWWTFDPFVRFLTASYGDKLATRDALKSRRLIQSAWYRARWGHVFTLTSDQNQKSRYENDRTGYRLATSVGGTGTGEGGDVILIDDPHKADEIESDVEREAVIDWHDGTIVTRFNDPDRGVEVLVMQRLHERDLAGHLIERGGWEHLCLPAEYEPTHPFVWPDDPRTEPGELLWPGHFGRDALDALKVDLGAYRAAGQLQQRPAPAEGGIFKRTWWRYYDPANLEEWRLEPLVALVASWDTALKEKTSSDYTVGSLWGAAGANRYLLRRFRGRVGLPDTKVAVKEMAVWAAERFPGLPLTILVELAANGPELIAALRDELAGLIPVSPDRDKVSRAHAVTPQYESGNVLVPGAAALYPDGGFGPDTVRTPAWVQEWIAEHSSFPNAANDDQVDSGTQALGRLRGELRRQPRDHTEEEEQEQERQRRSERERQSTAGLLDKTF